MRYVAVQAGMNRPWQMLQENLLVWFFTAYVHRLGTYLIDLNSGRLRVGAERYRAAASRRISQPSRDSRATDEARRLPTRCAASRSPCRPGQGGQVEPDQRPARRAARHHRRAAGHRRHQRYELQPPGVPTPL